MRRSRSSESGGMALFIAGAAVGACVALLLAPESGPESRHRLGRWLHDHHLSGHDALEKLKAMLAHRHDGHRHANGRARAERRHKRGFGA
jgi:hypothetical protein